MFMQRKVSIMTVFLKLIYKHDIMNKLKDAIDVVVKNTFSKMNNLYKKLEKWRHC